MQSDADRKTFGVLPLLFAVAAVIVGALVVGNNAQWSVLRAEVRASASVWGNYIIDRVPQIDQIVLGNSSLNNAVAFLWGRNNYGAIRRFRIYDPSGIERLDSAQLDFKPITAASGPAPNPIAAKVFKTGEMVFDFSDVFASGRHNYTANTFIPLVKHGEPIGVIEVVSDETTSWTALKSEVEHAGLQILGLVVLAFMLPGFLFLRRTGQLKFATNRLKHTVEYDALTGTLNRPAFNDLLRDQINGAESRDLMVAIHFIDLDRFKNINDTLGHAVGDEVLTSTARRLRRVVGTRERLARLGADEFAILQPFFPTSPEAVTQLDQDIIRELSRPLFVDGNEIQVGATVGSASYPSDGNTLDELVRSADIALAHAKETTRGGAVAFQRSMETERQTRQRIEARLRYALAHEQFAVHYQPLYSIDGGTLRGFEALLRLNDNEGQPISPAVFIPIAEEMGLIGAIGHWVLLEASRTACEWPGDLTVSVNLSPIQFQTHDIPKVVRDVLGQTGLPPCRLELEVTEGVLITDTEKVLRDLREIKGLGVSIALDDFGTGYSSLGYLWSFPFDKLKVDKSFMTDLAVDGSKSREILATIVALGKVLDLKITAEGVETAEQIEVLRALDCDLVQGFIYGRPLDAEQLAVLLAEQVQKEAMERASQRLQRGVGKTAIVTKLKSA